MNEITITVPTTKSGELAYFKVQILTSLEEALENISLLVKPSDVLLAEKMGLWKVL